MTSKANPASKDSAPVVPTITARIAHLMASLGIAGLPRNYELLFEALTGNAGVAREIAALGKAPDQATLDAIALRHALPSHNALAAGQAASEAARLLAELSATAEANRRDKAIALQELEEIAARMGKDPVLGISDFSGDAARLLSVVRDILGADRRASERMNDLHAHLDGLRAGLAISREALTHDPATGLANHAALLARLKPLFAAEKTEATWALLLMRVEQLKDFAESHAPGAAEKTLKRLAAIFRRSVKKDDFVARTGPDLFALLLCDVSRENAVTVARRVAIRIADKPFPFQGRELPPGFLTLTTGISLTDAAKSPAVLYEQAEQALAFATEAEIPVRIYSAEVAARAARPYRRGVAA